MNGLRNLEPESITFGIFSPEEIRRMSVCEVNNVKRAGIGSVYDPRMGVTDSADVCETCKQNMERCPGHFGHIELNERIIHPLFYKQIVAYLSCVCMDCSRLVVLREQLELEGLMRFKGQNRFKRIREKIKKVEMCCHCNLDQPKYRLNTQDSTIVSVFDDGRKNKTNIAMSTDEVYKILSNIPNEDVQLMGFDPAFTHPKNMIMQALLVCPPCDRPYVKADGKVCDDDLTNKYIDIVKVNNKLVRDDAPSTEPSVPHNNTLPSATSSSVTKGTQQQQHQQQQPLHSSEDQQQQVLFARERERVQTLVNSLKFHIATMFNNSQGRAKHSTNGRAIKGFKERISGKDAIIRSAIMGARAVTPDTLVLTYEGTRKRADEVRVGDALVGDDGYPRRVISTLRGTSRLYKVSQTYSETYTVSCDHILTLCYAEHCRVHWVYDDNTTNDVRWSPNATSSLLLRPTSSTRGFWHMTWYDRVSRSIKSVYKRTSHKVTREKARSYIEKLRRHLNKDPVIDIHIEDYLRLPDEVRRDMYAVKLDVPIRWFHTDVPITPRILGMWLADGDTSVCSNPVFKSVHIELVHYWAKWCKDNQGTFKPMPDGVSYEISVPGFEQAIKSLHLAATNSDCSSVATSKSVDTRVVPLLYVRNDEDTRLELLAGFIDACGFVDRLRNHVRITRVRTDRPLLDSIAFLCRTLGFMTHYTDSDEGVHVDPQFVTLCIYGCGMEHIRALLFRKRCRSIPAGCLQRITITDAGIGEYCGFAVDENRRFLLGDFTVTHNCDYSGRTVIGGDPTLPTDVVGVPEVMANILTVPVKVTRFNFDEMQAIVNQGHVDSLKKENGAVINLKRLRRGTLLRPGDIIHRQGRRIRVVDNKQAIQEGDLLERDGVFIDKVNAANRPYPIELGWTINRKLQDNDWIYLNRQPTLHEGSMMAMKVRVMKGMSVIKFNLAIAKSYNADFDGDEMNLHAPQSEEAISELKGLSAAKNFIISAQNSKPNFNIVQDALLGSYLMTLGVKNIRRDAFFDIACKLPPIPDVLLPYFVHESKLTHQPSSSSSPSTATGPAIAILERMKQISRILREKGKPSSAFTGKGLFSLFLPNDLLYEKKNNVDPNEPVIRVDRGVLYEGAMCKNILGSAHNSLIQIMHKEYGPDAAMYFIDCVHVIANNYLLLEGFSIGLDDCMTVDKEKERQVRVDIDKCYIEVEGIKRTVVHPGIREQRINAALGKAKDIGFSISKVALRDNNSIRHTVTCGSKGDPFNMAQITSLLGQQNLKGERIPLSLNHKKRSLPHYPFEGLTIEMECESRGFISSSFIHGLNPREFYFHAMTGREGISDTAMGTAKSGYLQHQLVKLMEDMKIEYDGTVRDAANRVYQTAYNECGVDPKTLVKVGDTQEICDISRMVNRLNLHHERRLTGEM